MLPIPKLLSPNRSSKLAYLIVSLLVCTTLSSCAASKSGELYNSHEMQRGHRLFMATVLSIREVNIADSSQDNTGAAIGNIMGQALGNYLLTPKTRTVQLPNPSGVSMERYNPPRDAYEIPVTNVQYWMPNNKSRSAPQPYIVNTTLTMPSAGYLPSINAQTNTTTTVSEDPSKINVAIATLAPTLGAVAGALSENKIKKRKGYEIIIRVDRGPRLVVVQELDRSYKKGDRIRITRTAEGTVRVTPE